MNEREKLIVRLKRLMKSNSEKQKLLQEENNVGPEVGFLTEEVCVITSLSMEMRRLGVTFDDCK